MTEKQGVKLNTTITVGNLLSMVGMGAAILMFVFSIHFTTNANRADILELKASIAEIQKTVTSIDKRLGMLEVRMDSLDKRMDRLDLSQHTIYPAPISYAAPDVILP
jgi:peptidoglycan hydrolase CwlO-like protein